MDLIALHHGRERRVRVERRSPGEVEVTVDDRRYVVDALTLTSPWSLLIDGRQHEVAVSKDSRGRYLVSTRMATETVEVFDLLEHSVRAAEGERGQRGAQRVEALMPGRVVKLLHEVGDAVDVGDGILVVEAMKMENEIAAETQGVIGELAVEEGQAVEAGDLLFLVEAVSET